MLKISKVLAEAPSSNSEKQTAQASETNSNYMKFKGFFADASEQSSNGKQNNLTETVTQERLSDGQLVDEEGKVLPTESDWSLSNIEQPYSLVDNNDLGEFKLIESKQFSEAQSIANTDIKFKESQPAATDMDLARSEWSAKEHDIDSVFSSKPIASIGPAAVGTEAKAPLGIVNNEHLNLTKSRTAQVASALSGLKDGGRVEGKAGKLDLSQANKMAADFQLMENWKGKSSSRAPSEMMQLDLKVTDKFRNGQVNWGLTPAIESMSKEQLRASGKSLANGGLSGLPGIEITADELTKQAINKDSKLAQLASDSMVNQIANRVGGSDNQKTSAFYSPSQLIAQELAASSVSETVVSSNHSSVSNVSAAFTGREAAIMSTPLVMHGAQWQGNLVNKLLVLQAKGMERAELQLDPQELGPLQVKLVRSQHEVTVSIQASHPQTKDLLEMNQDRLRDQLGQQGLELSQFDVSDQGEQGESEQDNYASQSDTDSSSGELSSSIISEKTSVSPLGLDVFA